MCPPLSLEPHPRSSLLLRAGLRRKSRKGKRGLYVLDITHKNKQYESPANLRKKKLVDRARAWIVAHSSSPGRACARLPRPAAFAAAPFGILSPLRCFFAYTGAALLGAPVPGLGGHLHGKCFSFPPPGDMQGCANPQPEFLDIIDAALLFRSLLQGEPAVLATDSPTSLLVIDNGGAHSAEV